MKKTVAYYRTSSSTNVGEDKDSLKRQKLACQLFAEGNGFVVEAEFYDANVKGKDFFHERPGFNALLEFCDEQNINCILFENASRLSREQFVQEMGYRELISLGFSLICADTPEYFTDNSTNPSANMIRQILGSVAEFQKNELVFKLAGARERKKEVNRRLGYTTLDGKGKCEGRLSYQQKCPDLVETAKKLATVNPKTGYRRSRRYVAMELARLGYVTSKGTPFGHEQVARLIRY
jgi:DNA invertase Pin-like site-specific DNA recombinase